MQVVSRYPDGIDRIRAVQEEDSPFEASKLRLDDSATRVQPKRTLFPRLNIDITFPVSDPSEAAARPKLKPFDADTAVSTRLDGIKGLLGMAPHLDISATLTKKKQRS